MFRDSFKYYKSKKPPPILNEVLDFRKASDLLEKGIIKSFKHPLKGSSLQYGLKIPEEWEAFELTTKDGLIFIKNPFTSAGQRYWIKKCLNDYSNKPYKLNIDAFNKIKSDENWWELAKNDEKLLLSLRWATMGYHHNWDTKIYSENNKSIFPNDLKDMTEYIAETLGFYNFKAEAAIINYYHLDSALSGHTDHSEQNLNAPLFSYSFGQTAIFLIGGPTIEEKPLAMFLHSGDVLIMSKQSRLCYHGVPKIIKTNSESWNIEETCYLNENYRVCKDSNWKVFSDYLNHSRINMNVRQVLNSGQSMLSL